MCRTRFTPLIAIFAALVLGMTSMTMAVARGQARVAGEVVICTGYGVTTISVDENGNPTGPVHICPDMVLAMMAAIEAAPDMPQRPEGMSRALDVEEPRIGQSQSRIAPRARGPPVAA